MPSVILSDTGPRPSYYDRWKLTHPRKFSSTNESRHNNWMMRSERRWVPWVGKSPQFNLVSRPWRWTRKGSHGATVVQVFAMAAVQLGRCGICEIDTPGVLKVDHDHVTGELRGMLCTRCNWDLGAFEKYRASGWYVRAEKYLGGLHG